MDDLFDDYDPRYCRVWLEERQYRWHILRNHPEMDDPEYIRQAVVDPDIITQDVDDELTEIYYKRGGHPDYPNEWVKVVVKLSKVITAYTLRSPKPTEKVIWTSENFSGRQ